MRSYPRSGRRRVCCCRGWSYEADQPCAVLLLTYGSRGSINAIPAPIPILISVNLRKTGDPILMPAKATKAPIRAKRTKTEIQREFDEIQEQSADAREAADPKIEEASHRHETEVREAVEGVTVESAVQRISGLGLEISKALAGLSGKLTEEVQLLASVREAVELDRKELGRLHRIDVAATAVDQLVQE